MSAESWVVRLIVIAFLSIGVIANASGDESPPVDSNPSVLDEFEIARDGDRPTISVEIRGLRYSFCVDTGATMTVIDTRLRNTLGAPLKEIAILHSGGKQVKHPLFRAPKLRIGRLVLPEMPSVLCLSLNEFEKQDGRRYDGFLGMDVLQSFIVEFDFDRGLLRFLSSVPDNPGTRIPLIPNASTCPTIEANVCGLGAIPFVIDTGCDQSITLDSADFDILVRDRQIGRLAKWALTTMTGQTVEWAGFAERVDVASFRHSAVAISSSPQNFLGLRYLSRYVVTLDVAGEALYLRPGKAFARVDGRDVSGMWLIKNGPRMIIESVAAGSPAATSGFRTGDVVVRVDEDDVEKHTLFTLRHLLEASGTVVKFSIEREHRALDLNLELPPDHIAGRRPVLSKVPAGSKSLRTLRFEND